MYSLKYGHILASERRLKWTSIAFHIQPIFYHFLTSEYDVITTCSQLVLPAVRIFKIGGFNIIHFSNINVSSEYTGNP